MPLTGTELALASSMATAIEAKMSAALGVPPNKAEWLQALCAGIAESLIPHLVSNTVVVPGNAVLAGPYTGTVTAPTTIE